ncbi:barstar family protein [Streptomyces sp. CB02488]|uniref:barstar family protein n=1 Tax=Streptomyces sp. CB02488 TaxID=1703920 RepID=UPI0009A0EDC8|nr:barstar family protein [Streptomyces sp. CB02488]
MATEDSSGPTPGHWQDCSDVYDFLDQIRLRPGMWLPGGSLPHLRSLLTGYRAALAVHGVEEDFAFWPEDDFNRWFQERRGIAGSLSWAVEIELGTPEGSTPVEEFFRLLDAYRSESAQEPARVAPSKRLPGIEYMDNTFVTLFRRRQLLTDAELRLEERGFRVVHLAAGEWARERDMHRAFAAALRFPDYYGNNLDALNDCLGDVACHGPYDDSPEGTGLVLSITDYDRFAAACPQAAQSVLDIVADQARRAAVLRRRFFCLVHSNDPDIRFEPVGAMPVMWNRDERADAERR